VGDLPPMPNVASRAIGMVENPNTSAQELTELLSSDTALAARVLKIANSAMFCRQREITTLNQAIMVIGFKALKGIIVAATLRQINRRFGKTEKLIWENSMCTAMSATAIARHLKKKYTDEIFLLGLLHSLGQIVFLSQDELAADYRNVIAAIKDQSMSYVEAEQNVFGFAHPLIGALVAKKWNFSAETCQIILHYQDPLDELYTETPQDEKTLVVRLADMIAHAAEVGSPEGYPVDPEEMKKIALKIDFDETTVGDDLPKLIEETKERFASESHIYS
jgi:HD-like signal output (HDOD) protein